MGSESTSVRPVSAGDEEIPSDSDPESSTEGPREGVVGVEGERIKAQKEGRFVRRVLDPRVPSEREVKEHEEMNHAVYRNWCPVCVRSSGKE